jgi:hypothetical protein
MVQHLPPVTTPGQGELGDDAAVLGYVAETRPWGLATCIDLVGLLAFRERLVRSQVAGIGLVLGSLALLAFNPP